MLLARVDMGFHSTLNFHFFQKALLIAVFGESAFSLELGLVLELSISSFHAQ